MKIDPHRSKERYLKWRERVADGIPGVSPSNNTVILEYLSDMEQGLNTGTGARKGARSYIRLNTLRHRLIFLAKALESHCRQSSLVAVTEKEVHTVFAAMRSGRIRRSDGEPYRSTGDYVKAFKAFWHWHMKVQRKRRTRIEDITLDLDTSSDKPRWVYLTEEDIARLCDHAKYKYRVLMRFLLDSGIRSPTELVNVQVRDLTASCTQLHIREDASKTFGRKIRLLLSCSDLQSYIREQKLADTDYLFPIRPVVVNRYFRRLGTRILGTARSPAGACYSELTMYDFRHSSACYWLPRYKSESALKYRFGWKKSEMIHYYTEFLGMSDTITEDDLHIGDAKTKLEQALGKAEREKSLLEEELTIMRSQMTSILNRVEQLSGSTHQGMRK